MGDYNADPDPDLDTARRVAFSFAFANEVDLNMDQFSTTGTDKVISLVRKIGSTRLQVLIDPAKF